MNAMTFVFLAALAVALLLESWLWRRQAAHVTAHRGEVPGAFRDSFSLEAHQKAADYTLDKGRLGEIERWLGAAITLLFTLGGGIDWMATAWSATSWPPLWQGVATIVSFMVVAQMLDLPIDIYRTFVLEQRHGFNRSTPRQFAVDFLMQWGLTLALGVPLLWLILWVMDGAGQGWWLWAWAILMGFSLVMAWAFPTFIAPLFNRFTPLEDEVLRRRVETLLERCGFHSKGIFVMDGSRRSGHGNAYFTGLGNNKRIVFFDTLLNTLDHDEVEAVLAHELGHFKRRHVVKMLLVSATITLAGFALLGWLAGNDWFYHGLGVSQPSNAAALLLFVLVTPSLSLFLQPLLALYQRKNEFEADAFAAEYAKASALVSSLVKLYRDNASTLTPDPLYSAFHYSHPPAAERIGHLQVGG
ncbi:MAG: M48 family peptidase [Methylococcaceae bacterium]|nr:MAG: M48 family peptidase [Methylococcaceae bacterium]